MISASNVARPVVRLTLHSVPPEIVMVEMSIAMSRR